MTPSRCSISPWWMNEWNEWVNLGLHWVSLPYQENPCHQGFGVRQLSGEKGKGRKTGLHMERGWVVLKFRTQVSPASLSSFPIIKSQHGYWFCRIRWRMRKGCLIRVPKLKLLCNLGAGEGQNQRKSWCNSILENGFSMHSFLIVYLS